MSTHDTLNAFQEFKVSFFSHNLQKNASNEREREREREYQLEVLATYVSKKKKKKRKKNITFDSFVIIHKSKSFPVLLR